MSTLLNNFYNDSHTREAVKEFLLKNLNDLALERVYNKGNTEAIADAREVIENSFTELRELFEKKKDREVENPAR